MDIICINKKHQKHPVSKHVFVACGKVCQGAGVETSCCESNTPLTNSSTLFSSASSQDFRNFFGQHVSNGMACPDAHDAVRFLRVEEPCLFLTPKRCTVQWCSGAGAGLVTTQRCTQRRVVLEEISQTRIKGRSKEDQRKIKEI